MKAPVTLVGIQARMGSSRLPGKVLLPLSGVPVLLQMVRRVRLAKHAALCAVLTTTRQDDDSIVALCESEGIPCFRGHPTDCLDRHYEAAKAFGADLIVKIPSDCPLIDPKVIDLVIGTFLANPGKWDYLSNLHPPTHPDGNDVEVMTVEALGAAWRESRDLVEREHTTPFLWRNPKRFRIGNVVWDRGIDLSSTYRLTLDYPEDLDLIRRVHAHLSPLRAFGVDEIVEFLASHPEVSRLNERRAGEFWYHRQKFANGESRDRSK